jgi:diketogulonate reductase-like aldo/keto reductase
MKSSGGISRRTFLTRLGAGIGLASLPLRGDGATRSILTKPIPKTGEHIPVIGMGTWITFNVGDDAYARDQRVEVLRTFFGLGGGVIDSSPMYGSSEEVVGYCLRRLGSQPGLFSATKVWTSSATEGRHQIAESQGLWGVDRFDLLQVHNLLGWKGHLQTLLAMKAQDKLSYVGITTSHGRRHGELEAIMRNEPIDFVQATYNALDREVEERILPLAAERGIAFIANRPFQGGSLIDRVKRQPLPSWAAEAGAASWAAFLLKLIVSHPAVTCAIPATSRVDHMRENMSGATGRLPTPELRARMVGYVAGL